jgi:hypothetical protein
MKSFHDGAHEWFDQVGCFPTQFKLVFSTQAKFPSLCVCDAEMWEATLIVPGRTSPRGKACL